MTIKTQEQLAVGDKCDRGIAAKMAVRGVSRAILSEGCYYPIISQRPLGDQVRGTVYVVLDPYFGYEQQCEFVVRGRAGKRAVHYGCSPNGSESVRRAETICDICRGRDPVRVMDNGQTWTCPQCKGTGAAPVREKSGNYVG